MPKNSAEFSIPFFQKTILRGFETSDNSELTIFYDKETSFSENWKELPKKEANETIDVSMQKYEGDYREIAFVHMRPELSPRRSLYTVMKIKILTDGAPFFFGMTFDAKTLIREYMESQ